MRVTTEECYVAVFVMSVQSIVGVIIQVTNRDSNEGYTKDCEDFTITEKAFTRAFSSK